MKQTLRRTFALTTLGAVVAAGAVATTSTGASAQRTDAAPAATTKYADYGFKAKAAGARLYVGNVQVLNIEDAAADLLCTRKLGAVAENSSILSTPDNDFIQLSASTSRTVSYREGDRVGVLATNTLGDIVLGDQTGQVPTPLVKIKGLTTVADAFKDASGYGHEETIEDLQLEIDLLPGQEVDDQLQDLLDAIPLGLDPVLDVLQTTLGSEPIAIPGLGSIGLVRSKHSVTGHSATSDAAALELIITATGETQRLLLGHSRARIGGPAPSAIFRSTSMPLEVRALDGALHLGHVAPQTIPCEGTGGVVKKRSLDTASVLLPQGVIAGITDAGYETMGDQGRTSTVRGAQSSSVGTFSIPALDLQVTGVTSRVTSHLSKKTGKIVSSSKVTIGKILYQGTEVPLPTPGQPSAVEGLGIFEAGVVDGNRNGKKVTGLRINLTDLGVTIDLANAATRIFHYR